MTKHLLEKVLSSQAPSGAFYTTVLHQGKQFLDENGLVTCLVVSELSKISPSDEVEQAIEKGLDFLSRCASDNNPNAYHFYPPGEEPNWMRWRQAPRADDTALFAMTLIKHGLMGMDAADRVVDEVLEPHRLHVRPEAISPWIQEGAYKTWLDENMCPNPVDCCVNANIAALLKFIGRDNHPGYHAAVKTVIEGVNWAARSPSMQNFLSPYHPEPNELLHAMSRAVEVGVSEFQSAIAKHTQSRLKPMRRGSGLQPVCSTSDGKTLWFSHTLQVARNMSRFRMAETA